MIFTMLGLSLLLASVRGAGVSGSAIAGLALSALGAVAFYLMQRRGLFSATANFLRGVVPAVEWSSVLDGAGATDVWIRRLYRHPRSLAVAEIWHALSWVLGAGETWLALSFLGHPVELRTAIVIESLGEAIRTGAFPVPAALGVQEGGFVLLGGLFGLTPDVSVALSLAKRVRELVLGIPGLIVWQAGHAASRFARRSERPGEG
jgi:putative membrane protein